MPVVRVSQPISAACAASIIELVSGISPGASSVPTGRISSPVGMITTRGLRRTSQLDHAGRGAGGDVDRAQPVALGQQQLGGADVLADRADVLVGRHGGAQLGAPVRSVVHVLAHDDGVVAGRQRVAGVDDLEVVQQHRCGLGGADGLGGPHGDAVHGRGVERGEDRRAHTDSAVTRPTASPTGSRTASTRGGQPAAAHASRHARRACSAGMSDTNGLVIGTG